MAITTVSSHVVSVNAIQGTLIADNAITAVHIATNAVSGTLIADNAVTAVHIAQNSITVTQLADDCVESDKIADGVITTNHLNKAMISSQTEVTPVAGDFVLLGDTSDSNNLKKAPLTLLLNSNVDLSTKLNLSGGTVTGVTTFTGGDGVVVQTASDTFLQLKTTGSGSNYIEFKDSGGSSGNIRYNHSTNILSVKTNGTDNRLVIDASGNVGIGTTSPTAPLSIRKVHATGYGSGIDMLDFKAYYPPNYDSETSKASIFVGTSDKHTLNTHGGYLAFKVNQSGFSGSGATNLIEAMRIEKDGKVGIGTSNPLTPLHVVGANGLLVDTEGNGDGSVYFGGISGQDRSYIARSTNDFLMWNVSNGPTRFGTNNAERMRIANDGIVYFGPNGSTADPRINRHSNGYDYINSGNSRWLKVGASSGHTNVAFQDGSGGITVFETAGTERMRIDSGGALHIGTTAQPGGGWDTHLNVAHDNNAAYFRSTGSGGSAGVGIQTGTYTSTTYALVFYNGQQGGAGGVSLANGNASTSVTYNTSSDYRMKENIRPLENGLDRLKQLKPVKFDWKTNDETSEGFIAHEVQEIFPDAIAGEKDGEEMQGMDYGRITPLLVKAIQEQQTIIDDLKSRLDEAGL